jgi:hypothetical protein
MKFFNMTKYYPKTQDDLQKLLKKLSIDDLDIEFEDESEIQGTICEFDEREPQYRQIGIIKPGRLCPVVAIIQSEVVVKLPLQFYKKIIECTSCYRKVDTWIEEIEENGGFVCKNGVTESTAKVIVKYYNCCYCKTKLKYIEQSKEFIEPNRRFRLAEQKNVYKMKQKGDKFSNCSPIVNSLFDLWGDLDSIHLFIGEKMSLCEYINDNVIENGCYVECRTDDHEKLRVTKNDWASLATS